MYGVSNSFSTLFSSLGNQSRKTSSIGLNALTSSIADYNMIRSGSYKKLMTAYFRKTDGGTIKGPSNNRRPDTDQSTAISKDSVATLSKVKNAAGELEDSAAALVKTGSNSVFNKVTKTDDQGNKASTYDTDKIYKAVKSFVDDYNDVMKSADSSKTGGVQRAAMSMANSTSSYATSLSAVGISIDSSSHQLSIDESAFKAADMNKVKSLFNGSGSYAYNIKSQAAVVEYRAGNEAAKANTYNRYGSYSSNYSYGANVDRYH